MRLATDLATTNQRHSVDVRSYVNHTWNAVQVQQQSFDIPSRVGYKCSSQNLQLWNTKGVTYMWNILVWAVGNRATTCSDEAFSSVAAYWSRTNHNRVQSRAPADHLTLVRCTRSHVWNLILIDAHLYVTLTNESMIASFAQTAVVVSYYG